MPRTFFCVSDANVFKSRLEIPCSSSEPDGSHPFATPLGSLGEWPEIWKERKETFNSQRQAYSSRTEIHQPSAEHSANLNKFRFLFESFSNQSWSPSSNFLNFAATPSSKRLVAGLHPRNLGRNRGGVC
jgi:hypothetical protein